jgi:uncharacterized protein YndB with AHSA1/START domain
VEAIVADIFHDIPIEASVAAVYAAISTPEGLDSWWTLRASGRAEPGAEFKLWFGREHDWRATVSRCEPGVAFEFLMGKSDDDWAGTRVGIELEERGGVTWVRFHHTGWPAANEHFRVSNCCWAMYLRILRRWLEYGERVAYDDRLDA